MASLPSTMKTLSHIVGSRSSADLSLQTVPIPTPNLSETEHLIRVHATAPCASELTWHADHPSVALPTRSPVPCYDVAGTVVLAPSNSPFQPGTQVYARTDARRTGVAREYGIVLQREIAVKPQNLDWVQAASVSLSALTAWQALFVKAGVGALEDVEAWKGKKVLATAASGAVGAWVVQLARLAGAEVVGTCGPTNVELVKGELGASDVINYRETSITEWCRKTGTKFDVVIDCVGGQNLIDCWGAVKEGGVLMSIVLPVDFTSPEAVKPAGAAENVTAFYFVMEPNGTQLAEITKLIEADKLKPVVDSVYDFDDYAAAFKRLDSGRARGKVVLRLAA